MHLIKFLFFLLPSTAVSAQVTIDLTVLNDTTNQDFSVHVPVSGSYFSHSREYIPQEESGVTHIELAAAEPGFYNLFGNFGRKDTDDWLQLFIKPGEHYSVEIDAGAAKRTVSITGPAAGFNQYLNTRIRGDVRYPWIASLLDPYLTDSLPENIMVRMDAAKQADLKDLGGVASLTAEQESYALADISLYYKSLFTQAAFQVGQRRDDEGGNVLKESWKPYLYELIAEETGSGYDLASRWHQMLLDLKLLLAGNDKKEELAEKFGENESVEVYWAKQSYLLAGTARESGLASFLGDLIRSYPYEASTLSAYEDFNASYPDSRYLPVLTAKLDEAIVKTNPENIEKPVNKHLEASNHRSLKDVLLSSEKPLVYIDLWATWCSPCKRQFTKKTKLDAFLAAYADKVEALYISIDKDAKTEEAIERIINFYGLKGRHIRSSESLRDELFQLFGKGVEKSLSIPRYVIATREGEILNPEANRPEDWEALRTDLEIALREIQ